MRTPPPTRLRLCAHPTGATLASSEVKMKTLRIVTLFTIVLWLDLAAPGASAQQNVRPVTVGPYTVLAWNDLGMHCLNPT